MKTTKRAAMSAVMFAVLGFGAAGAADLPKEGNYDLTSCAAGTFNRLEFSKGYVASTFEHTGTNRSNLPGGFGDGNTFHCLGVQSNIEGKITATTFCESMDKDGDKIFARSTSEDRKGTQETLAGTLPAETVTPLIWNLNNQDFDPLALTCKYKP